MAFDKCFNCVMCGKKLFPFIEEETENQQGSVLPKNIHLKMAELASSLREDVESVGSLGIAAGAI